MYLHTKIGGDNFYDSVVMVQNGDIWQAHIPPQYYGSTVIYYTTLSDAKGNSITLMDSTYIQYFVVNDSLRVVGTGTSTTVYSPYYSYYNNGWSRSIYMAGEINPSEQGGIITQIAYYNTTAATSNTDNVSFYFKATSDAVITYNNYLDPMADGATLVWGQATSTIFGAGWVTFTLHTPFYLPADSNLMVYCNNEDGSYGNNGNTPNWQYTTAANKNIRSYSDNVFPTTTDIVVSGERPNAQFTMRGSTPYSGYNLGILELTEPVNQNIGGSACSEEYVPMKIILVNSGEYDYDFSTNNVTLTVEVNNAITYTLNKILDDGILESGKADTIEITPVFPVYMPGQYDIKVWLTSALNNVPYDDTLQSVYISERLGLPVDENFSGSSLPIEFVSRAINSPSTWEIVTQGVGTDASLLPVQGTGMLAFTGTKGAMAHLSTRQLELRGTILPVLEFWYFHDTIPSEDYMDVFITTDGGGSYTLLKSILKQDITYGWKQYTADLTPYIGGQCINILFEAMQMSAGTTSQYIDRVYITSSPDLLVSEIIISPEVSACELTNKDISVVLTTNTNQPIDFSQAVGANLRLEVPGYSTPFDISLQSIGSLSGNSSRSILMASGVNIRKDISTLRAYLTSPVDNNPLNDTVSLLLDLQPALSVRVISMTGGTDCFKIESEVRQEVVIKNTGTVDLNGIELMLHITGDSTDIRVKEIGSLDLRAGEDTTYVFINPYIVPDEARYLVQVTAYMGCDSIWINGTHATDECADIHNLSIVSIDNPPTGQKDVVGSTINVAVSVRNESDNRWFSNVAIMALIEDEDSVMLSSCLGNISNLEPLKTGNFTIAEPYIVPAKGVYFIKVYLSSQDNYLEDDTMIIRRETDLVGIETLDRNDFTLSQNIPNPAANTTRIDYSIPESGEVIFHVHSISGQLLYSKTIEAANGKQSLELNTNTLTAGVYIYSIEYKGQRLVKRMSIQK
jgi:hypothetical protein